MLDPKTITFVVALSAFNVDLYSIIHLLAHCFEKFPERLCGASHHTLKDCFELPEQPECHTGGTVALIAGHHHGELLERPEFDPERIFRWYKTAAVIRKLDAKVLESFFS